MKPSVINGEIRIVYDGRLDWVRRRGLSNKVVNDIKFSSYEDAWSYLDKMGA